MSMENGKVCCNCRHRIKEQNYKTSYISFRCEVSGKYLNYTELMTVEWCKHWSKERRKND